MTPAEKKLWNQVLSRGRFENLRWTPQRPIDDYIVDFYCPRLKLAIEVDGHSHGATKGYDDERTKALEHYGLKVVRFANDDVLNNLDGVYQALVSITMKNMDADIVRRGRLKRRRC